MSSETLAAVFLALPIGQKRKKNPLRKSKISLCTFLAQRWNGSDIVCTLWYLFPCVLNSKRAFLDLEMVNCPYELSDSPRVMVYTLRFLCALCFVVQTHRHYMA